MKIEDRKKGKIMLGVIFLLIVLGVYLHHLFFLIPFLLGLMLVGFGKLEKMKDRRREDKNE